MTKQNLESGKKYRVKHKGGKSTLRVFKWTEKRFGEILCYVFTSRVSPDLSAQLNAVTGEISLSGRKVPVTEISIPHYELVEAVAFTES